jgi:RimJ/RimL family protein N-acetyltransferase
MNSYKILSKQVYSSGQYSIVPIRMEDRYDIMRWRNEQMYHLRQNKPLTSEEQDRYFDEVVSKLFDQEQPDQILFSYLNGDKCIGYGGLVHINWKDRNAEISFLLNQQFANIEVHKHWSTFLPLIQLVAFEDLLLHKIYSFAYDLRPWLYQIFEASGFLYDGILREHKLIDNKYVNIVIHSKINANENIQQ